MGLEDTACGEGGARPANLLVLMTDQQHRETIGCWADPPHGRTPNIDRLAAEGIRFDRHYVTIPLCVPSRASIWSSQYAHCTGVTVNDDGRDVTFPDQLVTLGDVAKSAGYACGYIGKWHVGREHIPQHGFTDTWWTHLRNSYEDWLEHTGQFKFDPEVKGVQRRGVVPFELAHDTQVADRTIQFMRGHRAEPFVAICSMRAPHDPYIGPFDGMYDPADVALPPTVNETFHNKPLCQQRGTPREWFLRFAEGNPDKVRAVIAGYWGLVHLIDVNVGRVLEALDGLGLSGQTLVVFLSDHGDQMGHHGLMAKGLFMYDDTTRVPCIFRFPGRLPAGKVLRELTSTLDIVPTVVELLGMSVPACMQGESMMQLFGQAAHNRRDAVFMEMFEAYGQFGPIFSVRTERWKYNWHVADQDELYDMHADPDETTNLAPDRGHRDTLVGLRGRIIDWLQATGDVKMTDLARVSPNRLAR